MSRVLETIDVRQSNIKSLKEEVEKLKKLLDDPEPGLITWRNFVRARIEAISQYTTE